MFDIAHGIHRLFSVLYGCSLMIFKISADIYILNVTFSDLPLKIQIGAMLGSLIFNKLSIACSADVPSDTRHEAASREPRLNNVCPILFFLLCRILKSLFS